MGLDRCLADIELKGDLLVEQALAQHLKHAELLARQRLEPVGKSCRLQAGHGVCRKHPLGAVTSPASTIVDPLQQSPLASRFWYETGCAADNSFFDDVLIGECRDDHDRHQHLEGDFRAVCTAAEGFSNRRNEVTHGIVRKFWWNVPPPKRQSPATVGGANKHLHCLVPAAYMKRKFDADDRNVYAYPSSQLILIEQRLQALAMETLDLRARLLKERPRRT